MIRWRLLGTTLPLTLLMLGLAYTRDQVLHMNGLVELSDVGQILAVVSLILGLMLAGVMSDYKESEKIPGELAVTLEGIGDNVVSATAGNADSRLTTLRSAMRELVATVDDWLARRVETAECHAAMARFRDAARAASEVNASAAGRCLDGLGKLRALVTRADVIMHTSFLPVGYALLYLLVGSTLILLLAASYPAPAAEYLLIGVLSLIYIYMVRLVRDVDDPFGFSGKKRRGGSAEVNPYPLVDYRKRLEAEGA